MGVAATALLKGTLSRERYLTQTITAPTPSLPPKSIAGFEIKECIGSGFFGSVYLAKSPVSNLYVAIKIADPEKEKALETEAHVLSLVKGHPNIVEIYDYGNTNNVHYLIMEFIKGASLSEMICVEPLAFSRAVNIFRYCLEGLRYLHDQGYLHRDVKPENIMETETGDVKLVDFGLAIKISDSGTGKPGCGTLCYSSPEQQRGKLLTPSSDIYSLGLTFIDILTGIQVMESESSDKIHDPFPSKVACACKNPFSREDMVATRIKSLPDNLPKEIIPFIRRITHLDPNQRFSTYLEITKALNTLLPGSLESLGA